VHLWMVKQEALPVPLSTYAQRVVDFLPARLARRADGAWELRNLGTLRTVRLDEQLGWPDLERSINVVGVRDTPQGRYVALGPGEQTVLALTATPPQVPHLMSSNALVTSWSRSGDQLRFRLAGHLPVNVSIAACVAARPANLPAEVEVDAARRITRLRFAGTDTQEVRLSCR
jgi:hypothetical protein